MENIIALGLLYRYLVTGKKEISENMASSYIKAIENGLAKLHSTFDINEEGNRFSDSYELSIDEEDGAYSFTSLNYDFLSLLFSLNRDLSTASLSLEALEVLGIELKNLPVVRGSRSKAGEIEIYAMNAEDARRDAEEILKGKGFSELRIGNAIPSQPGDKAYKVMFAGKHEALELDCKAENNKFKRFSLELNRDQMKAEIAPSMDYDNEVELEKLFVADIILMEGDTELKRNKRIVFPIDGMTYPNYFADFFDDTIMSASGRRPLDSDDVYLEVSHIQPLDKEMQQRYASIEEIEAYASSLNKQPTMKELKLQ
ncbi:MAG: hypothetical protein K2L98_00245 [Bacilli bacterium]|nr:hypothetical protein [Bacilli bacterium]